LVLFFLKKNNNKQIPCALSCPLARSRSFAWRRRFFVSQAPFSVGYTIALEWNADAFFCPKVTAKTQVKIELWEADLFFDDKVLTVTPSVICFCFCVFRRWRAFA
jgi:hypothetical protein